MPANVMIATATVNGQVGTRYTHAVMRLHAGAAAMGEVSFSLPYFVETSMVTVARNALASQMLENPDYTHLLFVDSDMGFEPGAVAQMLAFDKPFTACAYPRRAQDLGRLQSVAAAVPNAALAASIAQQYVGFEHVIGTPNADGGTQLQLHGTFVRTARAGMGLTLLRRDALETMRGAFPELNRPPSSIYLGFGLKEHVFQCFETLPNAEGVHMSEDFSFCERWTGTCRGEIWLNADPVVTHTGPATFTGRLMDRLQYGGRIG